LRPDALTLPDIDAAANLGGWAVAALCRSMSLDSVLTFLTAALLERQVALPQHRALLALPHCGGAARASLARLCCMGCACRRRHLCAFVCSATCLSCVQRVAQIDSLDDYLVPPPPQIVVFCPNVGLLSGVVLSLVPLLLPFHWQCLLLPVLPAAQGRLELMEVGCWGRQLEAGGKLARRCCQHQA
jgi:hypothetical protein